MLPKEGFNEWAKHYDEDVKDSNRYPFAGYAKVFEFISSQIKRIKDKEVLDVGIGTGLYSSLLHSMGAKITGIDYSIDMLNIAKSRISDGLFYECDLNNGLPNEVKVKKYHYIVSTYCLHHFSLEMKASIIQKLMEYLLPDGLLFIGDVAFRTETELEECKRACGKYWDDDEMYPVYETLASALKDKGIRIRYKQISHCAGVFVLEKEQTLLDKLKIEEGMGFTGWDFSYLNERLVEFPLPWKYKNIVEEYVKDASILLDMGTGGGEFLASLRSLPLDTHATEGYQPNIVIAKERLEPLGIEVREVNDDILPYNDSFFDLVINRHETYSLKEVNRVLKKGGVFITQQVGGLNDKEINELLDSEVSEYLSWNLQKAIRDVDENEFVVITRDECITKSRCYDIGALVYYLKCIPWQVEDFSVDKYYHKLEMINEIIKKKGYIDFTLHRFIMILRKK